jgi:hypothetical protein
MHKVYSCVNNQIIPKSKRKVTHGRQVEIDKTINKVVAAQISDKLFSTAVYNGCVEGV